MVMCPKCGYDGIVNPMYSMLLFCPICRGYFKHTVEVSFWPDKQTTTPKQKWLGTKGKHPLDKKLNREEKSLQEYIDRWLHVAQKGTKDDALMCEAVAQAYYESCREFKP